MNIKTENVFKRTAVGSVLKGKLPIIIDNMS